MNEKGYHHIAIGGLLLVLAAVFLISPYVIDRMKGLYRKEDAIVLNLEASQYPKAVYPEKVSQDMKSLLYLLSDAESRLNRLQTDSILLAWNSLDAKSRDAAVDSIVRDMAAHKREWSSFWDAANSPGWGSLSNEEKIGRINRILTSLLEEQEKIARFNARADHGRGVEK